MKKQTVPALLIVIAMSVVLYTNATSLAAKRDFWTSTPDQGIDFWREAEGLPQSRIRAILQTKDGYLWLGTDSGLVRFNGASFTAFTVETGSLRDNEVWALKDDDEGGL